MFNRVVDSGQLERILFIPTTGEAEEVLSKPQLVPKNTLHATVANSCQYYPAPKYRSYYKEDRSRGLLKANVEELVEQMKQQLALEEQQEREVEKSNKQANEEKMKHDKLIDAEETKLRHIRDKTRVKNSEIVNLKNEKENEASPVYQPWKMIWTSARSLSMSLPLNWKRKIGSVLNQQQSLKQLGKHSLMLNKRTILGGKGLNHFLWNSTSWIMGSRSNFTQLLLLHSHSLYSVHLPLLDKCSIEPPPEYGRFA